MSNNGKPWWAPIAHFAAHVVVGTAIFVLIAIPAVGLGVVIHYLPMWLPVPGFTLMVLEFGEKAIVVIDVGLLLIHLLTTAFAAVMEPFK